MSAPVVARPGSLERARLAAPTEPPRPTERRAPARSAGSVRRLARRVSRLDVGVVVLVAVAAVNVAAVAAGPVPAFVVLAGTVAALVVLVRGAGRSVRAGGGLPVRELRPLLPGRRPARLARPAGRVRVEAGCSVPGCAGCFDAGSAGVLHRDVEGFVWDGAGRQRRDIPAAGYPLADVERPTPAARPAPVVRLPVRVPVRAASLPVVDRAGLAARAAGMVEWCEVHPRRPAVAVVELAAGVEPFATCGECLDSASAGAGVNAIRGGDAA